MKTIRLFSAFLLLLLLITIVSNSAFGQTAYTIRTGDTLFSISRQFGVSMQAIAAANNIVNPNLIYAGQTIIIPDGSDTGSPGGPTSPPPAPPPVTNPPPPTAGGSTYVVKGGDTLYKIAVSHGVTIASLVQVNGITNRNLIYVGQVLTIPGGSGSPGNGGTGQAPPPTPQPPPPAPVPPPSSANLLPNPSFENGYYHMNGAPELQVPNGWYMEFDTGHPYILPESRVLPRSQLPTHEQSVFIWDGNWTMKVFKGYAPMSYRIFTDVYLQPGTYRFTANYFPDLVSSYNGGNKIWASPGAGEVAFIRNGVGGWSAVNNGTRNVMVQTFIVPASGNVRLGVAFRTHYGLQNNGFFFDNWSLQRVS